MKLTQRLFFFKIKNNSMALGRNIYLNAGIMNMNDKGT